MKKVTKNTTGITAAQNTIKDYLAKTNLFAEFSSKEIAQFAAHANIRHVSKGEYLFKQGSRVTHFFLLISGNVRILKNLGGKTKYIVEYGADQFLGEKALVGVALNTVSAFVHQDAQVVYFYAKPLMKILKKSSSLSAKFYPHITKSLAERIERLRVGISSLENRTHYDSVRVEHDLLGESKINGGVYYGIQTQRAIENFKASGVPLSNFPHFINSLALVKKACAYTNAELGYLSIEYRDAILQACDEIMSGHFSYDFRVDMVQGGAGTSTNMNVNEVIANRASEILGNPLGSYVVHPNNHVNLSQSTNDVYPTAVRVTIGMTIHSLLTAMKNVQSAFFTKGKEFAHILKIGRTQLQDAVPMTLGQEFTAFGVTVGEDILMLQKMVDLFHEINLGGTAIGTGINSDPKFREKVVKYLKRLTKLPLHSATDLIAATPNTGAFVMFSGTLKRIAIKLSKICNDLRLLSSGPRAGFNEINLPPMQPGSSIMPGKVNPVIPELVNQVAFQIIGNDLVVTLAAEAGQLQLNVMEPIMVFNLFQSVKMLESSLNTLVEKCILDISANEERCKELVDESISLVTALNPYIGYENSTRISKEALATGRKVADLVLEKKLLSREQITKILSPRRMTTPQSFKKIKKS